MRQFLDLVRENKALREKVEAGIAAANQNFVLARSGMTDEALNVALMAPKQEVYLETETKRHERGRFLCSSIRPGLRTLTTSIPTALHLLPVTWMMQW